jgi:histone deacetylase 1/2
MVTCRKFGLLDHVDGSLDAKIMEIDYSWTQIDQCIVSWLYTTISPDVLNAVMQPSNSAASLWNAINELFLDNRLQRAVYAKQEFHNLVQGEMTITAFCTRIKCLADTLRDVGSPVDDRDMLINLIRGLNESFGHCIAALTFRPEGLTFAKARSSLLLEERRLLHSTRQGQQAALLAAGQSLTASPPAAAPSTNNSGGYRGRWKKKKVKQATNGGPIVINGGPRPAAPPGFPTYPQLAGMFQAWLTHGRQPGYGPSVSNPGAGILGARPGPAPASAVPNHAGFSVFHPAEYHPAPPSPASYQGWDPAPLQQALQAMTLQPGGGGYHLPAPSISNSGSEWFLDTGATSHMASDPGTLSHTSPHTSPSKIIVANGASLPITHVGTTSVSTSSIPLHLNNVLVTPQIIKNLASVRCLTRDNPITIEFDAFGFSVKDLRTRAVILRCNSTGDLYPLHTGRPRHHHSFHATTTQLWHQRLGHLGDESLSRIVSTFQFECNKSPPHTCHACRLGKHVRLPFNVSNSQASAPFALVHCDVWTSPVLSISQYKYYLVILDDFSHYAWTFPLRRKSEVHQIFRNFLAYVNTQFQRPILSVQTDNGREFDNVANRNLLAEHGIVLRLSCPYTSQQNGRAERVLRTLNDSVRTLLFHAHLPPRFWAEALHTATYLLNLRPCRPRAYSTPHELLFQRPPEYQHLRVFGCLCYPNTSATAIHKLAPRSVACIFLGYPSDHRGYRCYDPTSGRILISRHVRFDESVFPYRDTTATSPLPAAVPDPPVFITAPARTGPVTRLTRHSPPAASSPDTASAPTPASPMAGHGDSAGAATGADSTAGSSPVAGHGASTGTASAAATPAPSTDASTASPSSPSPSTSAPSPAALGPRIHPMHTRASRGIVQPNPKFKDFVMEVSTSALSPLPSSVRVALRDPNWVAAMQDEFDALKANSTWTLVPRPPRANIITGKWVFRHKLKSDGTLDRYKARWVVRGFNQRPGVDFGETFSPVIKPATVRTVLHIAASRAWPVHQLDISNAFLNGVLTERVYCQQPTGFVDASQPDHVCLLSKSLYGLRQAPRAWYTRIGSFLARIGFTSTRSDTSLFVLRRGTETAYLLLYVDDIILTASSMPFLRHITDQLQSEFKLKDLGPLHFFLGVHVRRTRTGFFLSQERYADEILERAAMSNCTPSATPVDTKPKVSSTAGKAAPDATFYRSIAGALQYLTLTRPDISYAVGQICLHMHAPHDVHWALIKRLLRYLRGTTSHGLVIRGSSSFDLAAYSDADWAGCPDTRRSTSGFCVYLGDSLVSWSSKRQPIVSRSSAEAEYRSVANAVAECCWLRQLLGELLCPVQKATVVFCDNVSAVYLSANPVHHRRTKHIELDIHFVREKVALGHFRVVHVPTTEQLADIMTKGLPTTSFESFRSSLGIISDDAATEGGCKRT